MIKRNLTVIGIMCGTSKDGIDIILGQTNGIEPVKIIRSKSLVFPQEFPVGLRAAEYALKQEHGNFKLAREKFTDYLRQYIDNISKNTSTDEILLLLNQYLNVNERNITIEDLTAKYTYLCTTLISELLEAANISSSAVDVIGDHGIALFHDPKNTITIQIADGQKLADATGIFVVNNFRIKDVKNGGQGAPLAPIYHKAVLNAKNKVGSEWAVVNLGGTANITFEKDGNLIGFDTGPANVLLDWYIRASTNGLESFDIDGKHSLAGSINQQLLDHLKNSAIDYNDENFLEKIPPKSLDISNYKLIDEIKNYPFNDVCATLAAFTAYGVIKGIKIMNVDISTMITCGGGAKNPAIINYLSIYSKLELGKEVKILNANQVGINSDYLEAELFAYLAVKAIYNEPITFPATTGCKNDTIGGYGYLPRNQNMSGITKELTRLNEQLLNTFNIEN